MGLGLLGALLIFTVIISALVWFFGMRFITAENGHEVVLVDRPYFFGHEGVRETTLKPGSRSHEWKSTVGIPVIVTPQAMSVKFEDLSTRDGTFLDFDTSIQVQVTNARRLIATKGERWFENNLLKPWTSTFRDLVKVYTVDELLTKPEIMADMEDKLLKILNERAAQDGLDIKISDFNMGQGRPNASVIAQMDETSREVQAKITYDKAEAAQLSRKKSEEARGEADKAYAAKLGYSQEQVVQLEAIKAYAATCATSKCIIMAPGATPTIGVK